MVDASSRFLDLFVNALEPEIALARVDLDLEVLPQQLRIAVIRAEDQNRLVV